MSLESGMNQKLGPLKTWQWGAIVGGGLLVYYLYKHKSKTTSEEVQPSESFATGNPNQTAEGGSGGALEKGFSEQDKLLEAEQKNTEASISGISTAQTQESEAQSNLANEIAETNSRIAEISGREPNSPGANPNLKKQYEGEKKEKEAALRKLKAAEARNGSKKPGNDKARKKATHASQGQHHHETQRQKQAKKPSPHPGAAHTTRSHSKPPSKHTQRVPLAHAATHHRRRNG